MARVIPELAAELLKELEAEGSSMSEELLQSLYALFGNAFMRAAEMLENGRFVQYQTPNGTRKLYKVGSRNKQYTLFPDINFCFCPAFHYQVLQSGNAVTCKHVLAGKLAAVTKQMKVEMITDAQFLDLLKDLNESEVLS